jgi:8-oxo-dGTP pyrophosphatase MutT (NUDIX family)
MVDESDVSSVIRAAGGLVWRKAGGRKELAVIQRTRYGGDRTLPKGKLKSGEGWQEAALREVQEETSCQVHLGTFAGSVIYPVGDKHKVVLFWNMTLVGDCRFVPSDEVDALEWLPAQEALKRLDYEGERALVEANLKESVAGPTLRVRVRRWWSRIGRVWRSSSVGALVRRCWSRIGRICRSTSYERLASAHAAYSAELDHSVKRRKQKEADFSWVSAADELLNNVQQALWDGDVDRGWQCFNAAQRMELFGLEKLKDGRLEAKAQAVLHEADAKLGSWRKETVLDILADPKEGELKLKCPVTADEVYYASQILHEHHSNVYRRLDIIGRQFRILVIVAVLAAVGWGLLAPHLVESVSRVDSPETTTLEVQAGTPETPAPEIPLDNRALLASVALFGIMGASVSGLLSLARATTDTRIPNQLLSSWFTLTRPVIGAIAALAIHVFLLSGLLVFGEPTLRLVLAVSFAAGFSERLVVRAAESVSGGSGS